MTGPPELIRLHRLATGAQPMHSAHSLRFSSWSRLRNFGGVALVAWVMTMCSHAATATSLDLLGAIPADAAAVVFVEPASEPGEQGHSFWGVAANLLERGRRIGLLPSMGESLQRTLDVIGSLPVVTTHPFAVVVLDVASAPRPDGGAQLDGLSAALIIHTRGDNEAVADRVRHLLSVYTNSELARVDAVESSGATSYRLIDGRLPEWAVLQWGPIDDFYVVAIGDDTFARVTRALRGSTTSLATDAWFMKAHRTTAGGSASLQIYLELNRLQSSLGTSCKERTIESLESLHLQFTDRGLWSVGQRGRTVQILSMLSVNGQDRLLPLSTSTIDGRTVEEIVPPAATRYLILQRQAEDIILRVRDTYLGSLTESRRRNLAGAWLREEAAADVSVRRDLLGHLGDRIVFHTDPPHPLNIPLLCTILIEIEGSTASVRHSLDIALTRYRDLTSRGSNPPHRLQTGTTPSWLRRDSDGLWYVQFGLVGPAIGVTDGWIVIGYSPHAVRRNIEYLQSRRRSASPSAAAALP